MTEEKKTKLNLTFKNIRKGDFSDRHAMVDVYLDGNFISTYQWNPFWSMKTEDLAKLLKFRGGFCFNRDVEGLLGTDYASGFQNLAIWQGKKWGKRLPEKFDKKLSDIIFKYANIEMPKVYDVESALVRDAECFESSRNFEDFCWEFGYDVDSRKAEKAYNACKDIFCDLIKTVGMDGFQELKETHYED